MSDTIIKVEGLGKKYFIGHEKRESYTAMRDVISNNVKRFGKGIQRVFGNGESNSIEGDEIEEFWALNDINFEIKRGGRQGSLEGGKEEDDKAHWREPRRETSWAPRKVQAKAHWREAKRRETSWAPT